VGTALVCEECGKSYPVIDSIPVLHAENRAENTAEWYDDMFKGRSRSKELESDYLRHERSFVQTFASRNGITGPCLEIGCGVGLFAECVPNFIGLEYALPALRVPGFDSFNRVCADATRLPFTSGSMELVFSFNVLEHVPAAHEAFAEIDRVCARGGFVLLKPAWHCTRYNTELIPVRSYAELTIRQKIVKALLPVVKARPYKLATKLPWRLWRRFRSMHAYRLSYRKLTPYHGPNWIADADAEVSLDCHEGILFFLRRGYECVSHPKTLKQLLAGHDIIILRNHN